MSCPTYCSSHIVTRSVLAKGFMWSPPFPFLQETLIPVVFPLSHIASVSNVHPAFRSRGVEITLPFWVFSPLKPINKGGGESMKSPRVFPQMGRRGHPWTVTDPCCSRHVYVLPCEDVPTRAIKDPGLCLFWGPKLLSLEMRLEDCGFICFFCRFI